ncbi:MAG: alpha/beta hydrolase [Cyanomargarita calcarea GSE-NOS-MK-12-04C]|jgi:predicted dienelactone hydrolase|uniref:Alpha/beta hydrolase n=1 Tax=Cyanomargarita calcarea GSE-NOS-MK-12-04C TaxID=2839659 RepID=A0A951UTF6_9CYAN|nr:alpha/beta hydrolase [Cyanomargarita calcarea GSE-NOS-MK-12-04C]
MTATLGNSIKIVFGAFTFGVLSTIFTPTPGLGAEKIAFFYPPFGEFSLSTDSLEVFAKEGKITSEFSFYASRLTPEQLAQLRDLLSTRFQLTPTLVSQFTYSEVGETVLRRLGKVLRTDSRKNGFFALRAAFILAATDPQGITVVNVLRYFASDSVMLDFDESLKTVANLSELLKRRDEIVATIEQASVQEATESQADFSKLPDLRASTSVKVQKQSFTLEDASRQQRTLPIDLYLPQSSSIGASPVIVISHGVGDDRLAFNYLAQHLTSYGFAVAVLEHPGDNAKKFEQFFAGLSGSPEPTELINRPLDIKFALDELQGRSQSDPNLQGKLNLQQVGVIGHSLGGYTALAVAGANINFEEIRRFCADDNSLNLSTLLQCRASDLISANPLIDKRVKAIIALNPVSSVVLGQSELSQIKVPVMMVAGSADIVTPAVPEQIRPFTWLTTPNKYLVIVRNGTHFSLLSQASIDRNTLPVPPGLIGQNPAIARSYINALSVAFFKTHLVNQEEYRSYLSATYSKYISQETLNLSLVKSFSANQLTQVAGKTSQR